MFLILGPITSYVTDSPCNLIEKSNMSILSKEMNEKDRSLKTQILISTTNDLRKNEKTKTEKLLSDNGFFGDERGDFNIFKN